MRISEFPEYLGAPTEIGVFPASIDGVTYKATIKDFSLTEVNLPFTHTPKDDTSVQTINKVSGSVNAITGSLSVKVNNSKVTSNSIVFATFMNDDSAGFVKNVVVTSGEFKVNFGAGLAGESQIGFFVINK